MVGWLLYLFFIFPASAFSRDHVKGIGNAAAPSLGNRTGHRKGPTNRLQGPTANGVDLVPKKTFEAFWNSIVKDEQLGCQVRIRRNIKSGRSRGLGVRFDREMSGWDVLGGL